MQGSCRHGRTQRSSKLADITKIGSRAIIETRILGLIPTRWVAEHTAYDPPRYFEDVQISGPFKSWRHGHHIEHHQSGALLRDEIDFEPPALIIGKLAANNIIIPRLEKLFAYRHQATRAWCESTETD